MGFPFEAAKLECLWWNSRMTSLREKPGDDFFPGFQMGVRSNPRLTARCNRNTFGS